MENDNKKTVSKDSKKKSGYVVGLTVVAAIIAAVVAAVFLYVPQTDQLIPPMPGISFDENAQKKVLDEMGKELGGFKGDEEQTRAKDMIDAFELMNLAELEPGTSDAKLHSIEIEFKKLAAETVGQSPYGYLGMGDFLALKFHNALHKVLGQAKQKGSMDLAMSKDSEDVKILKRLGGKFVAKALKEELISKDGTLNAPFITPMVQFKVRWRYLGGVSLDHDLKDIERITFFYYKVKYSKPQNINDRMSALQPLAMIDESFDKVIAEAIIWHEGQMDDKALEVLEEAMEKGRKDKAIMDFMKFYSDKK